VQAVLHVHQLSLSLRYTTSSPPSFFSTLFFLSCKNNNQKDKTNTKTKMQGRAACQGCEAPAHYLPSVSTATACLACPPGTFMMMQPSTTTTTAATTPSCSLCAENTFNPYSAATSCSICPDGTRSVANRTTCFQCPFINSTILPFVEYFQSGCAVQCMPFVSYLRTNPYVTGGCASCASIIPPVGTYADHISCINWQACTNAPANALYTSPSLEIGVSKCEWACNTGYYRASISAPSCTQCVYVGFNANVHQPTTVCLFGCKPRIYSDPLLKCDQLCVDLFLEYNSGSILIAPRVRDYHRTPSLPSSRPHYIQGVCGTDETVPYSNLPFLRRGRWFHPLPTTPYTLKNQHFCCISIYTLKKMYNDDDDAYMQGLLVAFIASNICTGSIIVRQRPPQHKRGL